MATKLKPQWGVRSRMGPWGKWFIHGPFRSIDAAQAKAKQLRETGLHATAFAAPEGLTFGNKYGRNRN